MLRSVPTRVRSFVRSFSIAASLVSRVRVGQHFSAEGFIRLMVRVQSNAAAADTNERAGRRLGER